jgi:putative endonuclease
LLVIPEGNLRFASSTTTAEGENENANNFWVYILSNRSHILYIGLTNNLTRRVNDHRKQTPGSFTARYKVTRLIYFEQFQYINNAIAREKELKHWTRAQKIALIEAMNPTWEELMPDTPTADPRIETQIPFGNDKQGSATA